MMRIAVHWRHFGPYHRARLAAARVYFQKQGLEIVGLEVAGENITYPWEQSADVGPIASHTIFPDTKYERISWPEAALGVIRTLERLEPDAVAIAGYVGGDVWGTLAWCLARGRPAILMTDSKADDAPRRFWKEFLKARVVNKYAAALCAGGLHQQYLQRIGLKSARIFVGYDAVDNDYFWSQARRHRRDPRLSRRLPGLAEKTPYFLASSRFIPRKNLAGLLVAYSRYRARLAAESGASRPWRLIILGDGPERVRLETMIRDQKLAGVCLPGFRQIDELPAYYAHARVFIHPALQEQWGLVVNEAMASGLPVLVSERCGCVPELVHHGVNGFRFDPEDIQQMTKLLLDCSNGPRDLADMGAASRQIVAGWGPQRFAQGLYGAVQTVLGGQRA